jgi:hypothetical protein
MSSYLVIINNYNHIINPWIIYIKIVIMYYIVDWYLQPNYNFFFLVIFWTKKGISSTLPFKIEKNHKFAYI